MIFLKFDRRIFHYFDWTLLAFVLCVCAMGVLNIYSTGFSAAGGQSPFYLKQLQWIAVGLVFMMFVFFADYRVIVEYAYIIYGFAMILLVLVLIVGSSSHGAQRWLGGGFFAIQPSELMKVVIIITLARYFDNHKSNEPYTIRELFIPLLIVAVPFALILKQPDLGTALILIVIFVSVVFFMGVDKRSLIFVFSAGLILIPLGWFLLKDYQRERLITFLNPERDPLGSGYHIIQSKIAIGSGEIFGKGFLSGSQTQLKFLPEQQTDFVFSVFAEEWGFLGSLFLIGVFVVIIFWGLKIALQARDLLGTIIAFGVTALIAWEVFINIGMVLGILPVVGIPLPFFSYGGSAMLSLMMAIGLLINVSARRFILQK
ncbi:MAG TPA: rod shape-determining protein RodA [Smithella sp.]|mgnify:FL=1|nr:rod shape-determining protein RodA [Smithella sp.]